jgi:hypothetical protein
MVDTSSRYLVSEDELIKIMDHCCIHPDGISCPSNCEYLCNNKCKENIRVLIYEIFGRDNYPFDSILYTERYVKALVESAQHDVLDILKRLQGRFQYKERRT